MTGKCKQIWEADGEPELGEGYEEARRNPGHYSNPFEIGTQEAFDYDFEKYKQWRNKRGI